MSYNAFARGAAPVGVRTVELRDRLTGAPALTEVWYPAELRYYGQDQDEASRDRFTIAPHWPELTQDAVRNARPAAPSGPDGLPLLMSFHGGYGHHRETSHLATHLASHGYVVAAPDFPGDHVTDSFAAADARSAVFARTPIDDSARKRPEQASGFLDAILDAAPAMGLPIDAARIGTFGGSMGGYTCLALNSIDHRASATFAMCPMCGPQSPVPQVRRLAGLLHVDDWRRPVSAFVVTGQADPIVIAGDVRNLYARLRSPKRLAVIAGAGHVHFVDGAEAVHETMRRTYLGGSFPDPEIDAAALGTAMRPFGELLDEARAHDIVRALLLSHMEASLKDNGQAEAFLERVGGVFAARGATVDLAHDARRTLAVAS
jgi:dienelactone hydrolase